MSDIGSAINLSAFLKTASSGEISGRSAPARVGLVPPGRRDDAGSLLQDSSQGGNTAPSTQVALSDGAKSALEGSSTALDLAREFNATRLGEQARGAVDNFGQELSSRLKLANEARQTLRDALKSLTGDFGGRFRGLVNQAVNQGFSLTETRFSLRIEQVSLDVQDDENGFSLSLNQISISLEIRSISTDVVSREPVDLTFDGLNLGAPVTDGAAGANGSDASAQDTGTQEAGTGDEGDETAGSPAASTVSDTSPTLQALIDLLRGAFSQEQTSFSLSERRIELNLNETIFLGRIGAGGAEQSGEPATLDVTT